MRRRYRTAHRGFLRPRTRPFREQGIGPYRTGDILEALFSQIGELDRELATDLIVGGRRDADAARFRDALKPRRYIHAVPKNVMRFNNYVANIDAHTEKDALVFRVADCKFVDAVLELQRGSDRFDSTRKLRQAPIA